MVHTDTLSNNSVWRVNSQVSLYRINESCGQVIPSDVFIEFDNRLRILHIIDPMHNVIIFWVGGTVGGISELIAPNANIHFVLEDTS